MDGQRFDTMIRKLSHSRRSLFSAVPVIVTWLGTFEADARKKHHKHHRPKAAPAPQPVFNQFGCLDVGQPCFGDNNLCCSGICSGDPPQKGRPDTRACAAHNTSNCTLLSKRCGSLDPAVAVCNPLDEFATCVVTTGNAPFCGSLLGFSPAAHCQNCTRDADCLALGFPTGSACVQLGGTFCNGCEATQNRACLPPADPA